MARKISFDLPTDGSDQPEPPTPVANRVRPLLNLDRPIKQSSPLGAISQSLGGISDKAKRADEIEQQLLKGQTIVELDPAMVDGSFVADRMEATEEQNASFREIIRQHGQNVPILVRPKADQPGRYEVAFGHRRLRATRDLDIKVRAVVRSLTDEELVIAQGQENSGRTDLTFIERARFAARLEDRKFSRETIMAALTVDKAALSRLIAIATRVPAAVIDAIGPAPSIGRVRWQELSELLEIDDNRQRAITAVGDPAFVERESDKRFEALVSDLRTKATRARAETWTASDGTHVAKVMRSGKKLTLAFDDRIAPKFGDYVHGRLQSLFDDYKAELDKQTS
jgi:ParB family chromosome partitioning protein